MRALPDASIFRASCTATVAFLASVVVLLPAPAARAAERPYAATEEREACSDSDPLRRPLFGDTHVHTAFSFDAASQDTRNTPRDAYRFAKGERVGLQPYDAKGVALRTATLDRPLDWTVVTDHAELLAEIRACSVPGSPGHDSDFCWIYQNIRPLALLPLALRSMVMKQRFDFFHEENLRSAWRDIQAAAEEAYDRSSECSFTSFVGYEFTATAEAAQNLHRNVVFRNAKVPDLPPSWTDTPSAYALWSKLEADCVKGQPGCDALTIPHNSNLSGNGLMFATAKLRTSADIDGEVTREEAERRQRWEPLVEIMQHKGDSECLLGGDTTDEACGFEKIPYDTFAGAQRFSGVDATSVIGRAGDPKRPAMRAKRSRRGSASSRSSARIR